MKNSILEQNVFNVLKSIRGAGKAVMYRDSAIMFNAEVETIVKRRYFIESSQYENQPREYNLKCIGDSHTFKIHTFKNKHDAIEFFNNIEINNNGALIFSRYTLAYEVMHQPVCDKYNCNTRYYNDGYTALHGSILNGWLVSYCEGDICLIHCYSDAVYDSEVNAHVNHFKRG
jgi:hypothetical protein